MRRNRFLLTALALVGFWVSFSSPASAQSSRAAQSPTLFERLDEFGRKLLGDPSPRSSPRSQRPGSPTAQRQKQSATERTDPSDTDRNKQSQTGRITEPSGPARAQGTSGVARLRAADSMSTGPSSAASVQSDPHAKPLHERLASFRESPFGPVTPASSPSSPPPSPRSAGGAAAAAQPIGTAAPQAVRRTTGGEAAGPATSPPATELAVSKPAESRPTLAPPQEERAPAADVRRAEPEPFNAETKAPTLGPVQANESAPAPAKADEPADEPAPADSRTDPAPVALTAPSDSTPGNREEPHGQAAASPSGPPRSAAPGNDAPLFSRHSPVLSVQTLGPKRITVGKESVYEVVIQNSGQVAAEQVVVSIELPEWADVLAAEPSTGAAGMAATPGEALQARPFPWTIGRLEAKGREKLVLRIVPRQSKPFELAVKWQCAPVGTQNLIEVQEPKLAMRLDGPREVLFGKAELYRLELSNPGTGEAENVVISVLPEGTGDNTPATHRLGNLAPGEKKVIEVELTARQAGALTIKVEARADGGVAAQVAETIQVQRPALAVRVDALPIQYLGTEATYRIIVQNPGTAPTGKVEVAATVPAGARFVSCTHNGRAASGQGRVVWTLESLAPAGEVALGLTCTFSVPGLSRLEVACSSGSDLSAQGVAEVQVEAIADLKLSVKDPAGPVPVDADALYEIRIHNRGTKAAERIDVVTYFSQGLEPAAAEGCPHRLARGQILFDTIASLPAGEAVVLKVKARAEVAGNHIVRTEVNCKPLGTRLVSEETTHFFDTRRPGPSQVVSPAAPSAPGDALRTADRREPGPASQRLVAPARAPTLPTLAPTKSESGPRGPSGTGATPVASAEE